MLPPVSRLLHALLLIIFVGSWSSIIYFLNEEPRGTAAPISVITPLPSLSTTFEPIPVLTPTAPPSVLPTFQTIPDTDWSMIQPGLERRVINIYSEQNQHVESMHIWRLDQRYFRLDVAFDKRPKTLESWQKETGASIVLNGGYFSIENEQYFADGLIILDGQASGRSFAGYGGMLAVKQAGAEVRWLVEKPYDPSEGFRAALQAFPILVKPGGQLGFGPERENYARARRTVIAQDKDGRILFIVTPQGYFTLHQLSRYLTESDLNLNIALNLDGGGSTGILVTNPRELIASKVVLPFVILVYAR